MTPAIVSPVELDDHLSAWITPGGTIYRVPECQHSVVAESMGLRAKDLERDGWIHLSYGSAYIDPERVTEPQIMVLSVIKMVRLPKIDPGRWGCAVNNFMETFNRLCLG
jgi:hypothetical protein